MQTGEALDAKTYAVGGDNVLSRDDLTTYWREVERADLKELKEFVKNDIFKLRPLRDCGSNIIDATWVRRWKWDTQEKKWIIKSRLCGRGVLDKQKIRGAETLLDDEPSLTTVIVQPRDPTRP